MVYYTQKGIKSELKINLLVKWVSSIVININHVLRKGIEQISKLNQM